MTTKEKIAISVSAIFGFAALCIILIPIFVALGFVWGDSVRFACVEHNKLPYAMGENYVFVSQSFFDENSDYIEYNGYADVMYMRNSKQGSIDPSFSTSIPNVRNYFIGFSIVKEGTPDINASIICDKIDYESNYIDFSYGNYIYDIRERYDSGSYEIFFFTNAVADNGSICNFEVDFYVKLNGEDYLNEHGQYLFQCKDIFEIMLDNLVGYSHYQEQ